MLQYFGHIHCDGEFDPCCSALIAWVVCCAAQDGRLLDRLRLCVLSLSHLSFSFAYASCSITMRTLCDVILLKHLPGDVWSHSS